MTKEVPTGARLGLVAEVKIADLLRGSPAGRYEASGVVQRDGVSYVVFDNMPHIGKITSLTPGESENVLLEQDGHAGNEDVAYDPVADHFFALTEARARGRGFMGRIRECDGEFRHVSTRLAGLPA